MAAVTAKTIIETISEVYLASVQDIRQSVGSLQELNIDCAGDAETLCLRCMDITKTGGNLTPERLKLISDTCDSVCRCDIKNINLSQIISVNLSAGAFSMTDAQFQDQISSSLNVKADAQNGIGTFNNKNTTNVSNLTTVYNFLKSETFQSSMQGLRAAQIVSLKGPGTISTVTMTSAINYTSNVIMQNAVVISAINNISTTIIAETTSVAGAGLEQMIEWIMKIIIMFIMIGLLAALLFAGFKVLATVGF